MALRTRIVNQEGEGEQVSEFNKGDIVSCNRPDALLRVCGVTKRGNLPSLVHGVINWQSVESARVVTVPASRLTLVVALAS